MFGRHGLVSSYWEIHLAWVTDVTKASHYLVFLVVISGADPLVQTIIPHLVVKTG